MKAKIPVSANQVKHRRKGINYLEQTAIKYRAHAQWGRQRLEERLQQLAEEHGEVFPPKATPKPNPDSA
jgi:hypothetical protein